jgi:hypothetical protein
MKENKIYLERKIPNKDVIVRRKKRRMVACLKMKAHGN